MINDIKLSNNSNIKEGRIRDHSRLDILCSSCLQPVDGPHLDTCIANLYVENKILLDETQDINNFINVGRNQPLESHLTQNDSV